MSGTKQRVVPVTLRAGKKYVLGNGTVVTIEVNPHWQLNKEWPWQAVHTDGGAGPTYFKDNGRSSWMSDDVMNIARPAYEVGEYYVNNLNDLCLVESIDSDPVYCVNVGITSSSHCVDGRYSCAGSSPRDLMDYAPAQQVAKHECPPPAVESFLGRRVRSVDGYMGTVMLDFDNEFDPGYALIKYDDKDAGRDNNRFPGSYRIDAVTACAWDYMHQWASRSTLLTLLWTGPEPESAIKLAGDRAVDDAAEPILPPLPSPYIQEEDVASIAEGSDVEQYLTAALDEGMKLTPTDMSDVWHVYATTMRDIGDIISARIALRLASV